MASPAQVVAVADVELRAPIPEPPSVRDCLCFLDHMRNCQQVTGAGRTLSDTWYRVPAFYFACPATILGPYQDAPIAPGSAWQDFELEIAAVVGPAGADLTVEQAQQAIVGYTIFNDWSARDLQMFDSQLGIGQSKGKDSGVTLGPYLVTPDELEQYFADGRLDLEVTALVNDEVIGSGSTSAMDWTFAEVISYASRGVSLRAGDVFGSGTVPTCTLIEHLDAADPAAFRGWLHDGDVVTLRVRGLGEIRQTVRATPCTRTHSHTGESGHRHATATRQSRACRASRTRGDCTRSPTGCGRGPCQTAATAGATRAWYPATGSRCSSTRSSTVI